MMSHEKPRWFKSPISQPKILHEKLKNLRSGVVSNICVRSSKFRYDHIWRQIGGQHRVLFLSGVTIWNDTIHHNDWRNLLHVSSVAILLLRGFRSLPVSIGRYQCLFSKKWLMSAILSLYSSDFLWCFCVRTFFMKNGSDKLPWPPRFISEISNVP